MPTWTNAEIDRLAAVYNTVAWDTLISLFPERSLISIQRKASYLKLTRSDPANKKYVHNDVYFSVPNTESAYWAGFIAADGYVSRKENKLVIELDQKDLGHLQVFQTCIGTTATIKHITGRNSVALSLYGAHKLIDDLEQNYNIVQAKSLTLQPPNITDPDLIKAFIVGYIDGDGCISQTRAKKTDYTIKLTAVGTQTMVNWIGCNIRKWAEREDLGYFGNYRKLYTYSCGGKYALHAFTKMLAVAPLALPRKWNKVRQYEESLQRYMSTC